ncbi:hypothetical protein Xcel_1378 [Xylanimonas cellulosilytica DSM 15894]|uniref:Tubulin-like protein n=1 Tax=Xylanimonas cellulosilytica (strain DSM 15894 / JCM 12276 / CECT 5975 / KCTC 9989 / LMG 20990 / NBRC 107835 / XIL07) TaxID=446471 RepID=D1BRF4_XYLCX|nr:tubulin-like doman-containing protein [Xylanimonas cellulosilytica]ACZ30409.1 hypothetical protein Xcel_1378 [Xylanimonas cellulosilytica DSM 15894]
MLRPFLLVGVGGSGGKTLRIIREDLLRRLKQAGWEHDDLPAAWQMIHIDVPNRADGDDVDLPAQLPDRQYKGLVATGVDYTTIDTAMKAKAGPSFVDAAATWRPDPNSVNVSPSKGAGQYRTLGRIITIAGLKRIDDAVQRARAALTGTDVVGEMQEVSRLLGGRAHASIGDPTVIVITSIAGGTGAGSAIDVCDVIRALPDKWANDSVGFLYAPDVFDHLPDEARRGVRANALGTLAEVLNGYWNTDGPSQATTALFETYGVTLSSTSRRSGPRYPFLVGAKNEHVTYKSQNDIYRAMGRSIASWVASEKLQDSFTAYLEAQWPATNNSIPDRLPLHAHGTETPFCAIGSARVGLGRDRFVEYASQHLARTVVMRIVEEHERSRRGPSDDRTSKQVIRDQATAIFPAFLERSKLDERGLERNDIIDELKAKNLRDQSAEFRARVTQDIAGFINARSKGGKKGVRLTELSMQVQGSVNDKQQAVLSTLHQATTEQAKHWVGTIQNHLQARTAALVGQCGGPVADAVLDLLKNELTFIRDELRQEAQNFRVWSQNEATKVTAKVGSASGAEITATSDPVLQDMIKSAVTSVICQYEAELRDLVMALIPDFVDGVLEPLKDAIRDAAERLAVQRSAAGSVVALWPQAVAIPARLLPAPNEFLLEEPSSYPTILAELIDRTVTASGSDGRREAELQVLLGTDDPTGDTQALVNAHQTWVPKNHNLAPDFGLIPRRAHFAVASSPDQILARAEAWLRKEGTAVGRYMTQGLRDYLTPENVPAAEHARRLARFEAKFIAALNASTPLVKVNPAVLVNVHGTDKVPYTSHFGEIPLPDNSPAKATVRRVLESRDEWREEVNKAFDDGNGGFIDVFTHLNAAFEPVVFDSLMKPIASDWGQKSMGADGRAEFWRWRRARPLTEFVPVSTTVLMSMVKGWFVARRLGHLDLTPATARIWVPETNTRAGYLADFPQVMLRSDPLNQSEGLAVVLESMMLALVQVNTRQSVDPINPYARLRTLGEGPTAFGNQLCQELQDWVLLGANARSTVRPTEATAEGRQKEVVNDLVAVRAKYREYFATIESQRKDPLDFPPMWDLRRLIDRALTELKHGVEALETTTGDTGWS